MNTHLSQAASVVPSAGKSPAVAELPHVMQRIDHAISRIHEIATCLETHADQLFGPRPSTLHATSGDVQAEPHCLMGLLDQTLVRLHGSIDRLSEEAERNTRLA